MNPVWTVVLGFIFTTLAGGYIVQGWQRRNCHLQQRFLGHEQEYKDLRELTDELLSMLGARIYHMKRVVLSINIEDSKFVARISDYEEISKRWNERLASFYSRLTILSSYSDSLLLEDVQTELYAAGRVIDHIVRSRDERQETEIGTVKLALKYLDSLQARHSHFGKLLLKRVEDRRFEVYYGTYVSYSKLNLQFFSTWQLVKALFICEVESHHILCSTLDLRFPSQRREKGAGIYQH